MKATHLNCRLLYEPLRSLTPEFVVCEVEPSELVDPARWVDAAAAVVVLDSSDDAASLDALAPLRALPLGSALVLVVDGAPEAIAALPENQRASFVLNKYEHLNYQEIAEILECSTMAVKSLLSRARENLRQSLENYLRPK